MTSNRSSHHVVIVLIHSLLLSGLLLQSLLLSASHAQITLDGSLGPKGPLVGPDYVISANLGRQVGGNLFHSFGEFNVRTRESATFTGPNTVENVIGRVTGGNQSFIDGTIRSEIPEANLYLINPRGVVFGPNATLDVDGSFHVSTADYLRLGDNGRFDASQPEESILTATPPEAFGFLGPNPAPISIQGSFLQVPEGKTLSVVGGDIQMAGSILFAPSGQVNIASVASAGEVVPSGPQQPPSLQVDSFTQLGRIELSQGTVVNTSGMGGGSVMIRGGQLMVDNSFIAANTLGNVDGAETGIDLRVAGDVTVANGGAIVTAGFGAGHVGDIAIEAGSVTVNGGAIATAGFGAGHVGDIAIEAGSVTVTGGALIQSSTSKSSTAQGGTVTVTASDAVTISGHDSQGLPSRIVSSTSGSGSAGDVSISTPTLTIDGGAITTATAGDGRGGNVTVKAERVTLKEFSFIDSSTLSAGQAGTVTVTATDSISVASRISDHRPSFVSSFAIGRGNAGRVVLSAPTVTLDGAFIGTSTTGTGHAGDVVIEAGKVTVVGGTQIASSTTDLGEAGTVTVSATDSIFIAGVSEFVKGDRSGVFSVTEGPRNGGRVSISTPRLIMDDRGFISAQTGGDGRAGDVVVNVGSLSLKGGAQIASGTGLQVSGKFLLGTGEGGTVTVIAKDAISITGAGSGISSDAQGVGRGGNVQVQARQVKLSDGGTISAKSSGAGAAGNISISASDSFRSQNSSVTTEAQQGDGGNIELKTGFLVHLTDSQITATVKSGQGKGGNITVDPEFVVLNRSQIRADAFGGPGGNIRIVSDVFLASPDSLVSASSALGVAGTVDIRAPVTSLSGSFAPLPEAFLSAVELLPARCAVRAQDGKFSSFVLGGRDGLPLEPGGILPSTINRVGKAGAPSAPGSKKATP